MFGIGGRAFTNQSPVILDIEYEKKAEALKSGLKTDKMPEHKISLPVEVTLNKTSSVWLNGLVLET